MQIGLVEMVQLSTMHFIPIQKVRTIVGLNGQPAFLLGRPARRLFVNEYVAGACRNVHNVIVAMLSSAFRQVFRYFATGRIIATANAALIQSDSAAKDAITACALLCQRIEAQVLRMETMKKEALLTKHFPLTQISYESGEHGVPSSTRSLSW